MNIQFLIISNIIIKYSLHWISFSFPFYYIQSTLGKEQENTETNNHGIPPTFPANFLCVSNNQHPHLKLHLKILQETSTRSPTFPDHRKHSRTRISTSSSTHKTLQDPWPHNGAPARQNHHHSSFFSWNSQRSSSQIWPIFLDPNRAGHSPGARPQRAVGGVDATVSSVEGHPKSLCYQNFLESAAWFNRDLSPEESSRLARLCGWEVQEQGSFGYWWVNILIFQNR